MVRLTDKNLSTKEFDGKIENPRMWHLNATAIPVGVVGMVNKNIDTQVLKMPGNLFLSEIQKIMLMSTAHIFRKTLSI